MAAEVANGWAPILEAVELRSGIKGVFRVSVDGQLFFDRAEVGRMPNPGEIAGELKERIGQPLSWRKAR